MTVDMASGCKDSVPVYIRIEPNPVVLFNTTPDQAREDFPEFCFQNATEFGGDQWLWTFGNEGSSTEENECFLFTEGIKCHDVQLVATNEFGCTDSTTKTVCTKQALERIFIPNSFSPNDDQINDEFVIFHEFVREEGYEFYIYNRWGEEIFNTSDKNEFWDGKTKTGDPAQVDVYVYLLKYVDELGESHFLRGAIFLM